MPKVLIREYDNSTTGLPASDNFAVLVPGYFGTPEEIKDSRGNSYSPARYYDPEELHIADNVYEIKSQKDFKNYIGTIPSTVLVEGQGPTLEEINPNGTDFDKYHRNLRVNDFVNALTTKKNAYSYVEITDVTDVRYGKNGYLLKTIMWEEEVAGENGVTKEERLVTISLTKVDLATTEFNSEGITTSNKFCLIREGYEGKDNVKVSHIGNQIAYELLGLGYTVLYKKLDKYQAIETQLLDDNFWSPLKDKSVFNFRYITSGGYYSPEVANKMIALAEFNNSVKLEDADTLNNECGRGDCIALCDIDEEAYQINDARPTNELVTNIGRAASVIKASPYAAIFAPRVQYKMSDEYLKNWGNNVFPASFHYLACAAKTFEKYSEWYAVAGYNRGISTYDIEKTTVKVGEIAINTLAPRVINSYTEKSINLILHERGNYFLWGNRTAEKLNTNGILFHHFLNIRQLCTTIKKQLYTACRQFTFDPNSDLLWINFVNAIKPTLEKMRADQGIKGYKITKVAVDKKALLTSTCNILLCIR